MEDHPIHKDHSNAQAINGFSYYKDALFFHAMKMHEEEKESGSLRPESRKTIKRFQQFPFMKWVLIPYKVMALAG